MRDIWETIIVTGRRVSEVLGLRLDCTGRYGGLAMLWHDQTKVGRYDQAIRIPDPLFGRLAQRHATREDDSRAEADKRAARASTASPTSRRSASATRPPAPA